MTPSPVNGTSRVEDGIGVITVTAVYPAQSDELWEAITSPRRLARWFGDVRPRSEVATAYDASLSTGWSGVIRIEECEPPRFMRLSFIDEVEPTTTVTAMLEAADAGTRLTIEERGLPIDDVAIFVSGWHAQIDQLLADATGARPVEWRPRWEELRAFYGNESPAEH